MVFEPKKSSVPQPGLPQTNGTTPAARPTPSAFEPSANAATGVSVIGTDLTILGDHINIISKNKLQVDGDVRGNVHGKHVLITEEGSVVGMVSAETIEVRGGVRGGIRAVSVKLQATAQVQGDISHQKLAIAEGAEFDGNIRKVKEPKDLMPELDPDVIERTRHDASVSPFSGSNLN